MPPDAADARIITTIAGVGMPGMPRPELGSARRLGWIMLAPGVGPLHVVTYLYAAFA